MNNYVNRRKTLSKKTGKLFIVSAPSGAGKTTLIKKIIENDPDICVAISFTTRQKRPKEQDGIDYNFITREKFEQLSEQNAFIESAEIFGNLYGTSVEQVQKLMDQGRNVILEIDWQGLEQVKNKLPCQSIFILPPSYNELKNRLVMRAQDSEVVINQRLQESQNEVQHSSLYDTIIINDIFDNTVEKLKRIIYGNQLPTDDESLAIKDILKNFMKPNKEE